MKKVFGILLFVVLLTTTTLGYAVAQGSVDSRIVDLERQRLEKMFERQSQSKDPNLQEAASKTKERIEELNRDPEAYFNKKQGASSSPKVKTAIDPVTGKPVLVIVK